MLWQKLLILQSLWNDPYCKMFEPGRMRLSLALSYGASDMIMEHNLENHGEFGQG